MNILLEGYFDHNFGDDMMMRLVAHYLPQHDFYIAQEKKELLLPFEKDSNIFDIQSLSGKIDLRLRVTGSGFILRRKMDIVSAFRKVIALKKISKKTPLAVIGCNIGPFCHPLGYRVTQKEMKLYRAVTVRDEASYAMLRGMRYLGQAACYPDILFSMPPEWLFEKTDENCLGISVYRHMFNSNLYQYRVLASVADEYIEKTGNKVLLFAFDTETENDLAAAYMILSLCQHKEQIEIVAHNDNGENILKSYARCQKIVGTRFHSIVLALRMGIPVIPIVYSQKTSQMLQDLAYHDLTFSWDNLDKTALIMAVLKSQKTFLIDEEVFSSAKRHAGFLSKIQ